MGVPRRAVTAPTGSSSGEITTLAMMSENSIRHAPSTMDAGMIRRWSPPSIMRQAWGTMRPTNPMTPTNATHTEVRTEAITIIMALNLRTFIPSWRAWSSPDMNRLNSLAHSIDIRAIPRAGTSTRNAFSQDMLPKLPYSHHMTLVTVSLFSERNTVCRDENANPTMTPERM